MPPKKGLSQEEKLSALLTWFQASHCFYTLKEVEQKASKACKISSMQIKDLVASLVNEGLVEQEKCGTTNLYWSFQYSEFKRKLQRYGQLRQSAAKLQADKGKLAEELRNACGERDMDNNRQDRMQQYDHLVNEAARLQEELKLSRQIDTIDELVQAIDFFNELIETVLSYISHQSGTSVSILKTEFEIPAELEEAPQISNAGVSA
ncbi:Meiotic nuclear division protein 1 [Candida viswanathii]|uniref:Meiotic nuclear division protein 1 n=1 Tax=Candida viswanathii TaxID=5486 RepID=A0A367YBI7_9ASCO|nr:Meiotic nuclear division protein 1 [Candida viswanathii]